MGMRLGRGALHRLQRHPGALQRGDVRAVASPLPEVREEEREGEEGETPEKGEGDEHVH